MILKSFSQFYKFSLVPQLGTMYRVNSEIGIYDKYILSKEIKPDHAHLIVTPHESKSMAQYLSGRIENTIRKFK